MEVFFTFVSNVFYKEYTAVALTWISEAYRIEKQKLTLESAGLMMSNAK